MVLTSMAFKEGGEIPQKYTCDGENVSPPLAWNGVPEGAKSLALIVDDPDAPSGTFVHWVLYRLPATTTELAEAVPVHGALPSGAVQGRNGFKKVGYGGPCPPSGTHRYYFHLYALKDSLRLEPGATRQDLDAAMESLIIARTQLMGRYTRAKH